jgi:glucose-6-phosphate dehydrogenase assembly protein OpcA
VIADSEKLISGYLRSETGERLVGKTPSNTDEAWVRLTQLDARAIDDHRSDHLIQYYVQLDCYASEDGGQPEANLLGRTIREALVDMPNHSHADGTVTGVSIRGHGRSPDPDFEPARERVIIMAFVWVHA